MGRINKRTLLRQLQRMGSGSRAELARLLGISQPTAGRIVDELLEAGVLEEYQDASANHGEHKSNGSMGRPGRLLRLDSTRERFVGIQLGVSETCLTTLTLGSNSEDRWQTRFPTPGNAERWLAELRRASRKLGPTRFWGVVVSVPGVVNESVRRILFSPNLHWTEKSDLPGLVRRIWDLPVLLVQEERALALGHHAATPAHGDFLLVDFGEGVGGALVVGGKTYSSPLPISGELGHTPVVGNSRPCGCGSLGCLETLISTRGLLQSFGAATKSDSPDWSALLAHVAEHGLPDWLARSLDATAILIAGAINVLGVERVVVTGSLTEFVPGVLDYLAKAVVKGSMWARFGHVECVGAPRRRTAGLVEVGINELVIPTSEAVQSGENGLPVDTA